MMLTKPQSVQLLAHIMDRIERDMMLRTRKRKMFALIFSFSAFTLAGAAAVNVSDAVTFTGFGSLLALAYSDPDIVAAYFSDFLFAILESIPALSLALFGAALTFFFITLRSLFALTTRQSLPRV